MKNIMIDLETLSTGSNALILSIGANKFYPDKGIVEEFYENIEIEDSLKYGFSVDHRTLKFWLDQPDNIRKGCLELPINLNIALREFNTFIGKDSNFRIWANGASFDIPLLKNAYNKFYKQPPWLHWNERCYKTVVNSFHVAYEKDKDRTHNALYDAEYQTEKLLKINEKYSFKNLL